jgi:ubiquinone biosynthesis protein
VTFGLGLRNLRRIRQIASVVFRYGLGSIFDQLDVTRLLPLHRRRREDPRYQQMSSAKRIRLALAELGPTFIKLGQVLSARPDLLPPEIIAELRHLQDEGPTVSFERIRGVIEAELGQPLDRLFASFEETPLSSASLGQVHGATLRDGREVTVKVLRPGVEEVVRQDIQVISDLAALAHRQPALRELELPSLARQFADQIENELVYTIEAHNADRIRAEIDKHSPLIFIPEVIWPLTSRRVLTVVRVYGHRVDRLAELPAPIDRARLAQEFGHAILHQIFVEGLFHGDPHQGNVLVTNDGRAALLDFGIVGYLDSRIRTLVAEVLERADRQDVDGVLSVAIELGSPRAETELASLRDGLARLVGRSAILPRREFTVGELLSRAIRTMWLNHVRVPTQLSLVARALAVGEGVCLDLDPDFDFREVARVTIQEASRRAAAIETVLDHAAASAESVARKLIRLPARMERVLSLLERGTLNIRVDDPEAERRISRVARSLNHLALAVLATALLTVGTLGLLFAHAPHATVLSVIALAGGGTLGFLLALAILRPGHF